MASLDPLFPAKYCYQIWTYTCHILFHLQPTIFPDLEPWHSDCQSKLKESHYQLTPWRTDVNTSNFPLQSPSHPSGLELTMVCVYICLKLFWEIRVESLENLCSQNENGFELVPQPAFSKKTLLLVLLTNRQLQIGTHGDNRTVV